MGYITTDSRRSQYKLGFDRRRLLPERMRSTMRSVAIAPYVELASREWDFGLDKSVMFASYSECGTIQADQLPTSMIAARLDERDVVVMLYDRGPAYIAGVFGASLQAAAALYRYLNYNWLSLGWDEDGSIGDAPGALCDLYADDEACIAGVDIGADGAVIYHNRVYATNDRRPQAIVDLIQARAGGRMADIEIEVMDARMTRFVTIPEPMAA